MPPEAPQEGPLALSLQQLEELGSDHILRSLAEQEDDREEGAPGAAWAADRQSQAGHPVPSAQDRLMERLALLCATQSRAPSSAGKVPADMPQGTKQQEAGSRDCTGKSQLLQQLRAFRKGMPQPGLPPPRVPTARRLRPLKRQPDPELGGSNM
ncbi:hypothetical protein MUG91_G95n7 [Manis pentadactyla]|nr:hypothetical protein MUG91_G95n7 [Manis pentadactyla]